MKAEPMNGTPVRRFSSYPKALAAARRLEASGIACRVDAPPALCMNLWHGQGGSGIALRVNAADLAAARERIGWNAAPKASSSARSPGNAARANRAAAAAGPSPSLFGFLRLPGHI
jgi:hypothetical protein